MNRGYQKATLEISKSASQDALSNMYLPYQICNNIYSSVTISNKKPFYHLFYDDLSDASSILLTEIEGWR